MSMTVATSLLNAVLIARTEKGKKLLELAIKNKKISKKIKKKN